MESFKQHRFKNKKGMKLPEKDDVIKNVEIIGGNVSIYTFKSKESIKK